MFDPVPIRVPDESTLLSELNIRGIPTPGPKPGDPIIPDHGTPTVEQLVVRRKCHVLKPAYNVPVESLSYIDVTTIWR